MARPDCERYENLMAWVIGPAADPAASDEDRELSDTDIHFIINHQGRCDDPEHSVPNWKTKLAEIDARAADRFLTALADLARQERGELTPDSPHHWAIEALKEAGAIMHVLSDLVDRKYVFTYNLDANPALGSPEQCGVVTGTIVGATVSSYPKTDGECQVIQVTSSEQRFMFFREGQEHLVRVIGIQRASKESPVTPKSREWRLLITYPDRLPDYYGGISGTFVILPC